MACPNFSGEYVSTDDPANVSKISIQQSACDSMTVSTQNAGSEEVTTETFMIDGKEVMKTEESNIKVTKSEFIGDTFISSVKSFSKNLATKEIKLLNIMEMRLQAPSPATLDFNLSLTFITLDNVSTVSGKMSFNKIK